MVAQRSGKKNVRTGQGQSWNWSSCLRMQNPLLFPVPELCQPQVAHWLVHRLHRELSLPRDTKKLISSYLSLCLGFCVFEVSEHP